MTVKDIFGLIVRTMGLVMILFGLFDLAYVAAKLLGLPLPSRYPVSVDAISSAFYFIIGIAVILSATLITNLIYGRDNTQN